MSVKAPFFWALTMRGFSGAGACPLHPPTDPMRATFLVFALLFATAARGESKLPGGADACLDCHNGKDAPAVDVTAFGASVHAHKASCTDCHAGYAMGPHTGELAPLSASDQVVVARLAKARWPLAETGKGHGKKDEKAAPEAHVTAPRAYLACAGCHEMEHAEAMAGWQKSIHSRWLREDAKVAGPTCTSCHDSMHGRLARVGNELAPVCTSCHAASKAQGGTHAIVAKTDAASAVSAAQKKETCARCHAKTTDNFAALIAHKPIQ